MNFNLETLIIGLGSSGIGAALMNFLNARRNAKRDDFEKIVATWQADNDRLRQENDELRKELIRMHAEMDMLKARVVILESQLKT